MVNLLPTGYALDFRSYALTRAESRPAVEIEIALHGAICTPFLTNSAPMVTNMTPKLFRK